MRPENVNPRNFQVESIIYNTGDFSIAYGVWEGGSRCLGMRWNGENDEDPGYPKLFNRPVWFVIPEELKIPITKSLLELPNIDKEQILQTLGEQFTE